MLSPHTDDAELAAGGVIARAVQSGTKVRVVTFSHAEASIPPSMDKDILVKEHQSAMRLLKVEDALLEDFPVREFALHRERLLSVLHRYFADFDPDVAICPSTADLHQDHAVIRDEARRVANRTLLGFEPAIDGGFVPTTFIELGFEHVARKQFALDIYQSQRQLGRRYFKRDVAHTKAVSWGLRAGYEYAEAFETLRSCL